MATGRKLSYPPYFAGWLLTWPIIAVMGAQGYTGLVVFLALPVLLLVRPKKLPLYALAFAAFIAWIVAVSFWSPGAKPLIDGSFGAGTFTMDMVAARVGLTALACVALLLALRHVAPGSGAKSLALIRTAGFVQGAGVLVLALAMGAVLNWMEPISDRSSMTQNLLRNVTAYLLLLPILLAWLWHRGSGPGGRIIAGGLVLAGFVSFAMTGSQTAIIGAVFMLAAMALVWAMPRYGFRVLFSGLAAYIALAPVVLASGLAQLRVLGVPLPASFFSRSYSWELVGQKIAEKPFFGHGLEASHTWKDTYGQHPEWLADAVARYGSTLDFTNYTVIPTHPHNMALQIWAETGMVGAMLAALAVLLLGWRLKAPRDWSPVSRYAGAGLIGAAAAMFSFAYSMWNEAFWASVAVAAAVVVLQARRDASP